MRRRLLTAPIALLVAPAALMAQNPPTKAQGTQVLVLERGFAGPQDSAMVTLRKGVMYWADVDGSGTPEFRPAGRYDWPALVVPADPAETGVRRFEMHVGRDEPYIVRITDLAPGSGATLRLFRDDAETRRFAESHDRDFAIGVLLGGGYQSGYRLEPAIGPDPRGGRNFEGGIITQSGGRFSALIGVARQSVRDPDFAVAWFFIEPRARLLTGHPFGGARTDLTLTLRVGAAPETGPHHIGPNLVAPGIAMTQHLSAEGRRRGWSLYASLRHGRVTHVPESDHRDMNEMTAGLSWIP